ncbi:peptidoglycan-binding protein [Salipaludibacillus agaradhaerens]|uniref:peptidoglycan-binding protein n=1 Tax=Salipaludibacillus agaradhaerens TaxID=76935 RepID=UPI000997D7DA|nr:peptidoglycan-binding protein [Salipaludibacillus agaradhaerens]
MKVRHLIFLLVLLFSLVHFSSQYTLAEEENDEQVSQEKIEGEGESSEKENDDNLSSEESEHSPSEENNNENPEVDSNESLIENEEIIEVEAEEPIEVSSMVSDGNLFKRGDSDPRIIQLKIDLAKLGFPVSNNPNENFGPSTEEAVKDFQSYFAIEVHGMADETTLNKIDEILSTPLQNGGNHADAITLKENLSKLGFHVSNNPNTAYGPTTERRVREFQAFYNLRENGIADEVTLAKIEELINTPMSRGDYRQDVVDLKVKLAEVGFAVSANPNPQFGPSTERIVKDFQSYYGLESHGRADNATLAKIEEVLGSPFRSGRNHEDTITLKENLSRLGFHVSDNPNTAYGPSTEARVKEFQSYYGLVANGIGDEVTLAKLEELLSSSFQNGESHEDVITLKENLSKLGFHVSDNPNTVYGPMTERRVREFQAYYGLVVNGMADEATLNKIDEILSTPLQNGGNHADAITLKEHLSKLGFHVSNNPNTAYGPTTERRVREFQAFYNLRENGIADEVTLAKIEELINTPMSRGDYRQDVVDLKIKLAEIGFAISPDPTPQFGPSTEQAVKDFQSYYGLSSSGIVNDATLNKIEEILNSPFRNGRNHEDTITLKENLSKLGFHVSNNPNTAYGPSTELRVIEFQQYYGLVVNGIADQPTLNRIQEILNWYLRNGQSHEDVIQLKEDLARLGYHISNNPNENYGPATEREVRNFQSDNGLRVSGIADQVTLDAIQSLLKNEPVIRYTQYNYTIDDMVRTQLQVSPRTDLYRTKIAYVSSDHVNRQGSTGTVTASVLNVRFEPNTRLNSIGTINSGAKVTIIGTEKDTSPSSNRTWYAIEYPHGQNWQFARMADVKRMVNPNSFSLNVNNQDMYQFLVLSETSGVSATYLNNQLIGKGILEGRGTTFKNAAEKYSINEFYLLSHAILETGNGNSPLANGSIEVGQISANRWVVYTPNSTHIAERSGSTWNVQQVSSYSRSQATNIRKTYNMFGIGAVDIDTYVRGAIRAYEEAWFTPAAAIDGGTKFIAESYVHHPTFAQDTLYKMRWNPQIRGTHQYATDIGWAQKQTANIFKHYQAQSNLRRTFDIPRYK